MHVLVAVFSTPGYLKVKIAPVFSSWAGSGALWLCRGSEAAAQPL